ncbi:MAG: response regulator [Nitrospirae bacterium]|nr:response regulator [Nitrospirota bacterium]
MIQKFKDTSLGTRFVLAFLIVVIVPMVLFAIFSERLVARKVHEEIEKAASQNLETAWLQYYVRADQMKFGMLQATEVVERAILKNDRHFLREKMLIWKKTRPYVDVWVVVDRAGRVIARLNSDKSGDFFELNGVVGKALSGRIPVISSEIMTREMLLIEGEGLANDVVIPIKKAQPDEYDPGHESLKDAMMLTTVVPVMDKNSVVGAIITGDILNRDNFVPDTIAAKIPGAVVTIDMDGVRISATVPYDNGHKTIGTLLPASVMAVLNSGKGYRGVTFMSGEKYITAADPVKDNKGDVIGNLSVRVPETQFITLHSDSRRNILLATVFGVIFAIGTAVFVTTRLSKPLGMLVQKSREAASGNLDIMVPVRAAEGTRDEVSILARSFNYMISEIKERNRERETHLSELEKKTKDLYTLNEKLQAANQELEVSLEEAQSQQEELQSANEELVILNEELEKKTNELFDANLKVKTEEEELKQTRDKLRLIYDGIRDYIFLLDPSCTIVEVNKSFLNTYGLQEKDVIGKKCYDLVYGCNEVIPECDVNNGANLEVSHRHQATTKDNRIVERYVFPVFDSRGHLVNRIEYIRDITEELRLREQLFQAEKLSSLGEILSGVAHELNNPLTGVIGYCELLLEATKDDNLKGQLEKINDAALRCKKIIENLLSFARQHRIEKQFCDINEIIKRTLDLKVYQLRIDNIDVLTDLDKHVPWTMADPYTIQQVFLNIINNAHLAMVEKGGHGRLYIKSEHIDGLIKITFSDTGGGIPEADLSKIFDPFFTTREVGKGTGLGLSVSYGIIKEHNGNIYAASEPGEGSSFFVELPVVSPSANARAAAREARETTAINDESRWTRRRILIVDDEITILNLLKTIVEGMGHEVDTAINAMAAVDKIRDKDYDLIISDIKMPTMDGKGLYRVVHSLRPDLINRLIFTTGDIVNPETQRFLEESKCNYIMKPFTPTEIKKIIRDFLASGGAGSDASQDFPGG